MIQPADELVQTIWEAAELAHRWRPDHPQYVEGRFYLTPEQWRAVIDSCPLPEPDSMRAQAVWGIPVVLIRPNDRVELPSGKVLVYSAALESLYVFSADVVAAAGIEGKKP